MSNRYAELNYHCFNDCRMEGCPGHTAKIHIQTTSDYIGFNDGTSTTDYSFDPTTIKILMKLLKEVDYLPNLAEERK